jgi:NADH:ubiquinone oxidoreductase subunit 5 (subunit L)/multisubunit Na+/H+ antiporter MnhA subunit
VIFVKPTQKISQFLINFFDKGVVDKLVVMTPQAFSNSIGKISARMQNGKIVQYFALTFVSIIGTFYFIITKF